MRRIAVIAAATLLAGCAAQVAETPVAEEAAPPPKVKKITSDLIGVSAGELIQAFGQPALQVREGPGLKLPFRGRACILDAYLYPPQQSTGPERVTYVDARTSTGATYDKDACALSLSHL
ncbi:MAG TPA: hypothetical protein VGE68_04600 [Sphingomicrobium sp.]